MIGPGPRNLITDVGHLRVGHATDEAAATGVTTLICDAVDGRPWTGAVDVRGGGPGVRETETLAPENSVPGVHAIVLSGGSVFGLGAADRVTERLAALGVGLRLRPGGKAIPIVPAAVLHDLANPGDKDWGEPPYRELGRRSVDAASIDFAQGRIGAGRGAMAGNLPGGIGSVSYDLGDGLMVGALVAVNPVGSVVMPDGRTYWAWPFEIDGEFGGGVPTAIVRAHDPIPDASRLGRLERLVPGANTTLAVVATNAALSKGEAKRVAMMAHDGIARAVRPAHTPFDGDIVFALASGAVALDDARQTQIARIGSAAADCLARAIARGVWLAQGD